MHTDIRAYSVIVDESVNERQYQLTPTDDRDDDIVLCGDVVERCNELPKHQ